MEGVGPSGPDLTRPVIGMEKSARLVALPTMALQVTIISKYPPGGRCTLYAGYADVLAGHLTGEVAVTYTELADAHANGYPSLLLNGQPVVPADGVILMPADLCAALEGQYVSGEVLLGLAEALEAPLERMMDEAG